jgi:hypothetical protein
MKKPRGPEPLSPLRLVGVLLLVLAALGGSLELHSADEGLASRPWEVVAAGSCHPELPLHVEHAQAIERHACPGCLLHLAGRGLYLAPVQHLAAPAPAAVLPAEPAAAALPAAALPFSSRGPPLSC